MANLKPYLCERDLVVVSGFGCMAFAVTMAFPLNIFPIRFSIQTALFYRQPKWDKPGVRFAIAAGAVFSSLAVAIALPSQIGRLLCPNHEQQPPSTSSSTLPARHWPSACAPGLSRKSVASKPLSRRWPRSCSGRHYHHLFSGGHRAAEKQASLM